MSCSPEMFTYRQVGVLTASLNHTISVSTEPLLCTLSCFRAGPVSLGAGANVEQVAGGAGHAAPDSQVISCTAFGLVFWFGLMCVVLL